MSEFCNTTALKHVKLSSVPTKYSPDTIIFVKTSVADTFQLFITDKSGNVIPLYHPDSSGGGLSTVYTVTGTGVTGTAQNPVVDIDTFVSTEAGNLLQISTIDGKLYVSSDSLSSLESNVIIENTYSNLGINPDDTQADFNAAVDLSIGTINDIITVPPTYTLPTSTLTFGVTTYEVGTNITKTVTTVFTKNDAGNVNRVVIYKDGSIISDVTTTDTVRSVSNSSTIVRGNINYSSEFFYDEGVIKNDNLGNPSPSGHILAGSVITDRNLVGKLYYFYGSPLSTPSNSTEVRALNNKVFEGVSGFSFTADNLNLSFALPSDINTSNLTVFTSNNEELTSNFSSNPISVDDAGGSPTNYTLYTYQTALPLDVTITVTI